jgi:membrane dipeptidase
MIMGRRRFLCLTGGLAAAHFAAAADVATGAASPLSDLLIADPHAHPNQFFGGRGFDRSTPSVETLRQANVVLTAFAAVGDMTYQRGRFGTPYDDTLGQLAHVRRLEESGHIRLVRSAADLRALVTARDRPGGLMAIEGADALEGQLANLDAFHRQGVRLVQLMHERDNELGFNQRSSSDGPLTPFGIEVVERMNRLGMLVDAAHARTATLKGIVSVSARPVIDSHTSLALPGEAGAGSRRLRSWQEMEWIARSGGVVCTWPFAYAGKGSERTTLEHWAEEVVQMKSRLGMAHCGLGTDGGGGLPRFVTGWDSILSLPSLIAALSAAGLSRGDVAAYVGGNFLRVLAASLA